MAKNYEWVILGPVKYHMTIKEIATSVSFALGFVLLSSYAVLSLSLVNPVHIACESFFSSLENRGATRIHISSMNREFLSHLVIDGVSFNVEDAFYFKADQVRLDKGIFPLIRLWLMKKGRITLDVESPQLMGDITAFIDAGERENNSFLPDWFSYQINLNNLSGSITYQGYQADMHDARVHLLVAEGLKFSTISATVRSLQLEKQGLVRVISDDVSFSADQTGNLSARLSKTGGAYLEYVFGLDSLQFTTKMHKDEPFPVDFSAEGLSFNHVPFSASLPSLGGNLQLTGGSLVSGSVSIGPVIGNYSDYAFSLPQSTLVLKTNLGASFYSFATSEGQEAVLTFQDQEVTSGRIRFEGSYQKQNGFEASANLPFVHYLYNGTDLNLTDLLMSLSGSTLKTCYLNAQSQVGYQFKDVVTCKGKGTLQATFDEGMNANLELTDLFSNVLDQSAKVTVNYQKIDNATKVLLGINSQNQLQLHLAYERAGKEEGAFEVKLRADSLPVTAFKTVINTYAPPLNLYYDNQSTLTGNLSLSSDTRQGGRFSYDFVLGNLKFGKYHFNGGSTLSAKVDQGQLAIEFLTCSLQNYRLSFIGNMQLGKWLPSGTMSINRIDTGAEFLSAQFTHTDSLLYDYDATSSRFPNFHLIGQLAQRGSSFSSEATLKIGDMTYPIAFTYNLDKQSLVANSSSMIQVSSFLGNPLKVDVKLDDFRFPLTDILENSSLDAVASFIYNDKDHWSFHASDFKLTNIFLNGLSYDFGANIAITNSSVLINGITIDDGKTKFQGFLSYDGTEIQTNIKEKFVLPFTFALHLNDDKAQLIDLYCKQNGKKMDIVSDVRDFDLARFRKTKEPLRLALSLVGSTDLTSLFDIAGSFSLASNEVNAKANVSFLQQQIQLTDGEFSFRQNNFKDIRIFLDAKKGEASLSSLFTNDQHISQVYTEGSSADFSVAFHFNKLDSLMQLPRLKQQFEDGSLFARLSVNHLLVMGESFPFVDTAKIDFSHKDDTYTASSAIINFSYSQSSKAISLHLDPRTGLGIDVSGTIGEDGVALAMKNIYFDLTRLNRFFETPIIEFKQGIMEGDLYFGGSFDNPRLFGQVYCDSLDMTTFWLPQDELFAKNIVLWADGSSISSALQPVFATNRITGETVQGTAQIGLNFNEANFESFNCDLDLHTGSIYLFVPIPESNLDIRANFNGKYHLQNKGNQGVYITGTGTFDDAKVTIGIKDCPSWYVSSFNTSTDFTLTTGKNNTFFYPNTPSPVFSATISEGQTFRFSYDHIKQKFDMSGYLGIRNGEIFYFQKNFFITEGSLAFRNNDELNILEPVLNLRARMRNFDSSGNPVDIYLVLNDNSLSNLSPSFESTPSKSLEEIMGILGESILPSTAYGDLSLYKMASMATLATDVAQRFGLIGNTSNDLSDSIRRSLGLDMFNLRSSILQNIIIDVLPGSNAITVSPLARYLNNTSIFMGKYVGKDMFLQVLLHLSALNVRNKNVRTPFLVNDLSLDLEVSLEWDNPLCTYSLFTQPNELSLINILDTIGFSVTKRIVLR